MADPIAELLGGTPSNTSPVDELMAGNVGQSINTATSTNNPSEFMKGVYRGTDNNQAAGYGFIQALSQLVGAEAAEEWAKDGIEKNLKDAALNPARISSYKDIETFADFGDYAASALGEQTYDFATTAIGGFGSIAAKAALGKAIMGQVTRKQALGAFKAGLVVNNIPQTVGETQLEFNEAGIENPIAALTVGAAKTALEVGPLAKLFDDLSSSVGKTANVKDLFKRAAEQLGKQSGLESITEGAQTTLDKAAIADLTDTSVLTQDNFDEILNSMIQGGIVGGTTGAGTQLTSSMLDLYQASQKDDETRITLPPQVEELMGEYLPAEDPTGPQTTFTQPQGQTFEGEASPTGPNYTSKVNTEEVQQNTQMAPGPLDGEFIPSEPFAGNQEQAAGIEAAPIDGEVNTPAPQLGVSSPVYTSKVSTQEVAQPEADPIAELLGTTQTDGTLPRDQMRSQVQTQVLDQEQPPVEVSPIAELLAPKENTLPRDQMRSQVQTQALDQEQPTLEQQENTLPREQMRSQIQTQVLDEEQEADKIIEGFTKAGLPVPSSNKEIAFSANAFMQDRQPGYIQTPGEETPQLLLEDKSVQSVEITPDMTDDKQVIGGRLFFKDPAVVQLLKEEGTGAVQNYGVNAKPDEVEVGVIPIDKDGNYGSPVLASKGSLDSIIAAQHVRAGENGQLAFVKPDQIKQVLRRRIKDLVKRQRQDVNQEKEQIREESGGYESPAGRLLDLAEVNENEVDGNNSDVTFGGFSVSKDQDPSTQKISIKGKSKNLDDVVSSAIRYGAGAYRKGGQISFVDNDNKTRNVNFHRLLLGKKDKDGTHSGGFLDIERADSVSTRNEFERYINAMNLALAQLTEMGLPPRAVDDITSESSTHTVATIDGKKYTYNELVEAAKKERGLGDDPVRLSNKDRGRIEYARTKIQSLNSEISELSQGLASNPEQAPEIQAQISKLQERVDRHKATIRRVESEAKTNQTRDEYNQQDSFVNNKGYEGRKGAFNPDSFSEEIRVAEEQQTNAVNKLEENKAKYADASRKGDKKAQDRARQEITYWDNRISELDREIESIEQRREEAQKQQQQGNFVRASNTRKEVQNNETTDAPKSRLNEDTNNELEDTFAGPTGRRDIDTEINLEDIDGIRVSRGIDAKEKTFLQKVRKLLGNETPLLVLDESDLDAVIRGIKAGKIRLPLKPIENLHKALKSGETGGRYIPMGDFAVIGLKSGRVKNPKTQAKRLLILAHEFGHVLFNTKWDTVSNADKARLEKEFKESGEPDFEEWFADQTAAWAKDTFSGKKQRENRPALKSWKEHFFAGFKRIFDALKEILPDRFKTNHQFAKFMDKAVRDGLFSGKDRVGFGEFKNYGREEFNAVKRKLASITNSAFARKIGRDADKLYRTADARLRKMGAEGSIIANIFYSRSTTTDHTDSSLFRTAERKYTFGESYSVGENVFWNGMIYSVHKDHVADSDESLATLLSNGFLKKGGLKSENTPQLKGWFNARAQKQAQWEARFKDIMPEDPDLWDEWLRDNAINQQTPEFKEIMDDMWKYAAERMGGKLGKIDDYMPRIYDPEAIINDIEGFKAVLRNAMPDISNAKMEEIIRTIIAEEGAISEELFEDSGLRAPGNDNVSTRMLKDIPESALERFMATPSHRLFKYIHKTTSRAEYETRAGAYNTVEDLENRLKRQAQTQYVNPKTLERVSEIAKNFREEVQNHNEMIASLEEQLLTHPDLSFKAALQDQIDYLKSNPPKPPEYWNPNGRIDEAIEKLPEDRQKEARHIIEGYMGRLGISISPESRKLQQWMMAMQYYTTLAFATISSVTDIANIMARGKVDSFGSMVKQSKVLFDAFKNRDDLELIARTIGVIQHDTVTSIINQQYGGTFTDPTVQKWNDRFFRAIGLEWFTKTTRIMAMSAGFHFIEESANNQRHGARFLNELGLTRDDVKYWQRKGSPKVSDGKDPGIDKIVAAVNQFADESILRPNAAQRPTWGSDLGFFHQLVWQLKSFYWAFGTTVIKGMAREIKARQRRGDSIPKSLTPLLFAGVPLMGLAAIGLELKEFIKYGNFEGPSAKMGAAAYTFELFDRAGGLGPASLLVGMYNAPKYGDSPLASLLGPTAEHIDSFFGRDGLEITAGLRRAIPYVSQTGGKLLGYDIDDLFQ
ncbi:hypothetical protein [Alteromonas mediterranea]|uniref:Large polyvalent protein associated domain-containing protein n=1 Tax=Alteromonas mediterranea (strain DSM 17117 / CIP 110805 / LMG 28347 / Deep ecotype) TaxID=1774373 RepID=F2GC89_ALTMD|nr:hypothetical protein [Alteromonas mediterranea]AEA99045.1 hypothetical protein MADE_1014555 [Alteromonas mediterranea DE]